jgi:Holliday junction resolvase-like predicted endonuclease
MTPRQCEIAAEAYAASLLAQAGYDVLVQYGANQPYYDLVANKGSVFLPISVKGSQDGGWMLAVKYKQEGATYHDAIDRWLAAQRPDVIFMFIQFFGVSVGELPRSYIARPPEIAAHMKTQCHGRGHGSLQEDYRRNRPGSKYDHKIPSAWLFSQKRLEEIAG